MEKNSLDTSDIDGVRSRLRDHIKAAGFSINSYEQAMGLRIGAISKFLSGHKNSFGIEKLINIVKNDSELDLNWLMSGQVSRIADISIAKNRNNLGKLEKISLLKEIINEL